MGKVSFLPNKVIGFELALVVGTATKTLSPAPPKKQFTYLLRKILIVRQNFSRIADKFFAFFEKSLPKLLFNVYLF